MGQISHISQVDDTTQQWRHTRVSASQAACTCGPLFGRECTYLVTGGAPGFYGFGVVPPAEQFAVLVKVDEIHQELFAYGAGEAARMPAVIGTQARSGHTDIAAIDRARTLKASNAMDGGVQGNFRFGSINVKTLEILTLSQWIGACSVTGICLTAPLPSASLFLCAANSLSSFFSSSLRLLQYLKQ